ncbi:hypothetical protein GSI_14478 [Ganoderma sinense ZZ0214-1]|uniref:Uncharacterized protein n=1 Tax=Ganoderma sinense ZZ0214-1 TaxID=1077348 RepID=A0A2G8RNT7_9APHY|nr:hypothetical protein GSI_14478 [Ganoderma sinense ZZ0214-1]
MSSPIAIHSINTNTTFQSAHGPNMASRSLPGNASGLYVPVHRRGASTSSTSSSSSGYFFERGSLSPIARPTHDRTRSVSPMPRTPRSPRAFGKRHLDVSPAASPRAADIPLASMIPNTYTISQLLALSSSIAPLSPSNRAQIDAHIPLMTRRLKSSSPSSPAPSSSSVSSSPVSETAALPTAPAPASTPKPSADAQKRRRRPGRKNSGGKPRVAPALGTDVEERRRRHGANWGWAVHAPEQDSWRSSHAVAVVA